MRVLIVDDEPDILWLVRDAIDRADGIEVVGEATSGDEALELWRRDRPDVVVLDQRMPGLSGLEVAAIMRSEHPGQQIILFSGQMDRALREQADALGIDETLSKDGLMGLVDALQRCAR